MQWTSQKRVNIVRIGYNNGTSDIAVHSGNDNFISDLYRGHLSFSLDFVYIWGRDFITYCETAPNKHKKIPNHQEE